MMTFFAGFFLLFSINSFASYIPNGVSSKGGSGADIQSVIFGSGTSCSSTCSTTPCSICTQIGNKITSVSRVGGGSYNLNGIDGTKYVCTGVGYNTSRRSFIHDRLNSTSSYVYLSADTDIAYASVICIGVP